MHPVTATLLVLSGASLLVSGRSRAFATGLASLVGGVAALRLIHAIPLASAPPDVADLFALGELDQMAIGTSVSLAMLMVALLLAMWRSSRIGWLPQVFAVLGGSWAVFALVGYLLEITPLYSPTGRSPMAVHTAVALVLLTLGILCSDRDSPLSQFMFDPSPISVLARRLVVLGILLETVISVARLLAQEGGWLTRETGAALHAVASIGVTLGLVVIAIVQLMKTERRRQEQEAELALARVSLLHFSRNSAMATMAGTLAHELNQPLTALANYAAGLERLVDDTNERDALKLGLSEVRANAHRAGEIIRRMRSIAEGGSVHRAPLDLRALISETLHLLKVECAPVRVQVQVSSESMPEGDPVQIQQVLVNLVRNACEALTGQERKELQITVSKEDEFTRVSVCDSGPGIDPSILPTLFEPKPSGKANGMGIGLSISRTIIEAHGGRLTGENLRHGGACFSFTLPNC